MFARRPENGSSDKRAVLLAGGGRQAARTAWHSGWPPGRSLEPSITEVARARSGAKHSVLIRKIVAKMIVPVGQHVAHLGAESASPIRQPVTRDRRP
jgi:hypothetical protein